VSAAAFASHFRRARADRFAARFPARSARTPLLIVNVQRRRAVRAFV
jgi:hypothetical protein